MARQAMDRNEVALEKRREDNKPQTFVTKSGVEIKLKDLDLLFVQQVTNSVHIPAVPTYTIKTASGRQETYPLDKVVVEQSPEFKPIWEKYLTDLANAQAEQARRSTRAIYLEGTEAPDDWYDAAWEKRMKIIGIALPEDREERWIQYLETALSTEESMRLIQSIIRRTSLPEEVIQQAEDAFRDTLRTDE